MIPATLACLALGFGLGFVFGMRIAQAMLADLRRRFDFMHGQIQAQPVDQALEEAQP
jgi:hypothetical protein